MQNGETKQIRLGLPKGRMEKGVLQVLAEAGIQVRTTSRAYRPVLSLPEFDTKVHKPQDIVEMLHHGSRDIGFSGADWVTELEAEVVELIDLKLDPVRLVAAAPEALLENGRLPKRQLVVASEYERLSRRWISESGIDATFVRSFGATEVFPPEDADCIIDNTATGATLRANGLSIVDDIMTSSTRLYANPRALENPSKREHIERFVVLIRSVLDARERVMLEVNVSREDLESLVEVLPCLRKPTIASLHGDDGYVVKAAVPRKELPLLITEIKARGGTGIVVTLITQLVP
ncbi:MAG: ATP phosphoribosyltransferase [Bdellovibrionales bacterium]|nr:ATP phosphoribosyltransferase [Bdellovibrionales bacterium]